MIRTINQKIKAILVLLLLSVISIWGSFLCVSKAEVSIASANDLSLSISQAEVVVLGEDDKSGLEFTLSLPQNEYEALIESVGTGKTFKNIETGVIIAPAYYADEIPFSVDSLFGLNASYDWATYSGSLDAWNYVDNGKIRVVNINTNLWENKGDVYTYSGAIVDILETNETEVFLSFGYVRLVDAFGGVSYKLTSVEKASVAETALLAIIDGKLNETQEKWVLDNWLNDKILFESQATVEVNVDDLSSKNYSIFEVTKDNESVYNFIKGIKSLENVTVSMEDANGNTLILDEKNGTTIDLANEKNLRAWDVQISYGEYALWTGEVDFYSLNEEFLWNDEISTDSVASYNISKQGEIYVKYNYNYNGGAKAETVDGITTISYIKSGDNGSWYVWKPLHSKKYYENYVQKGISISITISADGTNRVNVDSHVLNQGYIWGVDEYLVDVKDLKSLTKLISIDDIVDNWDAIIYADWNGVWGTRNTYGMVHAYNITNGGTFMISDLKVTVDGNFPSVEDGSFAINLDEVENRNAVDVAKYVDSAVIESIKNQESGAVVCEFVGRDFDKKITVNDLSSVDMSGNVEGIYDLSIKVYGVTIYDATVEIYSSTNIAWANGLSSENVVVGRAVTESLGWTDAALTKLAENDGYEIIDASLITDQSHPLFGKTGTFLKLESLNSAEQLAFSVKPMHDLDHYKKNLQNKDYVLTFDVYATGSFNGMSAVGGYYCKDTRFSDYVTWRGSINDLNKWVSFSLPFDSYLLCESASDSFSGKYLDYNNLGTVVNAKNTMFQFEASSLGSVLYVSTPRIETMPDVIHWSSTDRSIDIGSCYEYDLTDILSQTEKIKYDYYGTKYGYDKIFFKLNFADNLSKVIWANADGSINVNLLDVLGKTDMGASITIADKLLSGGFSIDGRLCDINGFPGHTTVGVFGTAGGTNNNQKILKTGNITFTNLPAQVELYEIAVADGTVKVLRDDYSSNLISSVIKEGNLTSICVDSVEDLTKSLSIKAFKNEVEAGQIQIVSKTDVSDYRIVLKDLTSGTNVLGKENISLYHLLYTNVAYVAGSLNPTGTGEYPDAILPMDAAIMNKANVLKAGKNQGIWVSVSIPADQPAGVYTGSFRINLGASTYDVPISVTVYDYAVAEETYMKTTMSLIYDDILNLETPSQYDENDKIIVNASGNKDGTVSEELLDAYIRYMSEHRIGTSPVLKDSAFAGAWQGYPYEPSALFSTSTILISGVRRQLYKYPLRKKDANGSTVFVTDTVNKTGYDTTGYPLYLDRIDEFFNQMVELAKDEKATSYRIPVQQAVASNFNNDNIANLYSNYAGQMNEIRSDIPDGQKAYVINQLVLRDTLEMFFKKAMELHKNGTSVDVFKKAMVCPNWIDEFAINESKTFNAQYLLKYMKNFFPNCANWLKTIYSSEINNDPFLLEMLDSLSQIKIHVTADTLKSIDADTHYANYVAVLSQYDSEEKRQEATDWANTVYNGAGEKWVYTAMADVFPNASMQIEVPLLSTRMTGWMMSEYDISGFLYWATMKSKYADNIYADKIAPIVGETVKDGEIIKLDDYYNNAIHYSNVAGDGFLLYPGSYYNVTGPIGSIRLEALTDSIEDYNLFYDLKEMYKDAGVEDGFYNVMRRLSEMLYTNVACKIGEGYTTDFITSRESLANMLILARDNGVFVLDVYSSGSKWYFSVAAPSEIADAVKTSINATFVNSLDITLNGSSGKTMVFEVPEAALSSGYLTVSYANKTVKLSIETLVETAKVESFTWANVNESATTTFHISNYSNGANGTSADVSIVTLSDSNSLGGRTSGRYFRVMPSSKTDVSNLGFSVLPSSLDWGTINAYKDKAILKFDVYMETTKISDGSKHETQKIWYSLGKSTNTSNASHEWFTVSISFAQILENWSTLMDTSAKTYNNWTTSQRALFAVNGSSHSAQGVHSTGFYMGNFRIVHS